MGNLKHISLVDASKTMLEKAQQLLGAANLAKKVDIINERFDKISRSEYIQTFNSKPLKHLARLTRPE